MGHDSFECFDSANFAFTQSESDEIPTRHATAFTKLPISAEQLSVVAKGNLWGNFRISQSSAVGSDVEVSADIYYEQMEDMREVALCLLHPGENKWGFGIFVSCPSLS